MRSTIALALVLLAVAPGALAQTCSLRLIGELSVQYRKPSGLISVDAQIQGQPIAMALATAARTTQIDRATAERLKLEPRRSTHLEAYSATGAELRVFEVVIPEMMVGSIRFTQYRTVITESMHSKASPVNVGVFSLNELSKVDIEFDVAGGKVNVFAPSSCLTSAPWSDDADTVPLIETANIRHVRFEVKVDGQALRAELDSASPRTALTWRGMRRLGLSPDADDVEKGRGGRLRRFQSFTIGEEEIRNPKFAIVRVVAADQDGEPEIYLGADWLQAHRVYVGRGNGQMHFTYNGGQVFEK